jgi:serine protease inhibitor ecotin
MHVKESRISQADQIYKAMKERVNSRNKSPCKAALKIDLNLGKTLRVDSVQQPNFLKAYCIQTNLTE